MNSSSSGSIVCRWLLPHYASLEKRLLRKVQKYAEIAHKLEIYSNIAPKSAVLANYQLVAALYQLEMFQHVHAEQDFVEMHIGDQRGVDVV